MITTSNTNHTSFAFFSSIRRKLTAIIMGVSSAALLAAGVLIIVGQLAGFRQKMAVDLTLQAKMIANNCLASVSFRDPQDAGLVLRTLSQRTSLAYAHVSTASGDILAFYRREGFTDDPQTAPGAAAVAFEEGWLLAEQPIVLDGKTIGSTFLQADLSELTGFCRQITTIVLASLATVFLMAWVVSFRLQKFISVPIERLTGLVRDVSLRHDYALRATNIGRDEVGVLANAFNEMLDAVELRDKQLGEREQRTKAYLNVAGVMIVALDYTGIVTLINPKGCEILGLKESDVIGKDWFANFVPLRDREALRTVFGEIIRGEAETIHYHENPILAGNGEERLIAWNNAVIRDATGCIAAILSSGEDITDRRQAEEREAALREQLARAERMKSIGVLAGGVAHDLNNILGPVVALPELIKEDLAAAMQGDATAGASMLESLDIMEHSAQRAACVVQDLLAVSRRGHYQRSPTDINKLACLTRDSRSIKRLADAYPNVTITLHTCPEPLMVLASEDHICRVVDNLIRNAAEAIIDGQGSVSVSTSRRRLRQPYSGYTTVPAGDYAIIVVKDTGIGMEPAVLNRIFEPFFTRKTKSERSGSGLGLSIVNGIVDDHDGYIDVESTVGVGTTFTVYMQLTDAPDETGLPDDQTLIRGNGRILVVDDEPGQRFLARSALARLGYTVGLAENGCAALQLFTDAKDHQHPSPYDLVMLDMMMPPGPDGLDTFKAIRALYPAQKVLIASGHAEDHRSSEALSLGAKWLCKPYNLNSLSIAVAGILQSPN
jgi:PAS domain S-box-containing protein